MCCLAAVAQESRAKALVEALRGVAPAVVDALADSAEAFAVAASFAAAALALCGAFAYPLCKNALVEAVLVRESVASSCHARRALHTLPLCVPSLAPCCGRHCITHSLPLLVPMFCCVALALILAVGEQGLTAPIASRSGARDEEARPEPVPSEVGVPGSGSARSAWKRAPHSASCFVLSSDFCLFFLPFAHALPARCALPCSAPGPSDAPMTPAANAAWATAIAEGGAPFSMRGRMSGFDSGARLLAQPNCFALQSLLPACSLFACFCVSFAVVLLLDLIHPVFTRFAVLSSLCAAVGSGWVRFYTGQRDGKSNVGALHELPHALACTLVERVWLLTTVFGSFLRCVCVRAQ